MRRAPLRLAVTMATVLTMAVAATGLAAIAPAGAATQVQPAELGVAYSGDSGPTATDPAGRIEAWRLGGTGLGSRIVIDVTNSSPTADQSVCLTLGEPAPWQPGASWCTLAPAVVVPPGTTRVTFTTTASSYVAHVAFGDPGTGAVGPYTFTYVSHEFLLEVEDVTGGREIDRRDTVRVFATLGGESEYRAPRGTTITVVIRSGERRWTRTGTVTKAGRADVALELPKAARGPARLAVTAAKDGYVTSEPLTRRVSIT